jgi:hypothetical protein
MLLGDCGIALALYWVLVDVLGIFPEDESGSFRYDCGDRSADGEVRDDKVVGFNAEAKDENIEVGGR